MGPRAPLILAALSAILLIGCGADDGSNGIFPDMGAQSYDLGQFADSSFCASTITITADPGPDTTGGFVFAPTELTAVAVANTGSLESPMWTVALADGATFTPEVVDTASGLTVRFAAPLPGSYTFRVRFPFAGCEGMSSIDVHTRNANQAQYRLRISPPESVGLPQQDLPLTVFGGGNQGALNLALVSGTPIMSTLRGPGGAATAGEVRLIADSGPDAVALAGDNGAFALAVSADALYTPLLLPTGANAGTLAPRLLAKGTGLALAGGSFSVDAGQAVSGTVRDPADAAIAGARVVLRNGLLPSGTGISGADGSWSLRAQPGSYLAALGADGWPELSWTAASVASGAPALNVKYLVARVAVSAKIVASDGITAVAGARVTLRSPSLPGVATVDSGSGAAPVAGRVKQLLVSAADGTLPALQLPLLADGSSYDLLIEPPAGAADGVTRLALPLTGAATWTLTLQPKIMLRGKVSDLLGDGVGNVKVTAFESAGLGAAPSARTASDGSFTLAIDPGSAAQLLAEPPGSAHLASARLALPVGATQANLSLPPGLLVAGTVTSPSMAHLPSVLIDALCGTCGSTTPVASAISDATGAYALYLPDPGVTAIDGGVLDASP